MNNIRRRQLGRRKAYLRKCVLAHQLMLTHESSTSVRVRVFEEYIEPVLLCSYQQYNNMLNVINPQKELEDIEVQLNNE